MMPAHLWKVLEGASVLMDFDPDGATATLH